MTKRIKEDHKFFRDIVSGKMNKEVKRLISSNDIIGAKGKNGKISIRIPSVEQPHFVYGNNSKGIGRGPGNKGDKLKKGNQPGKGKGSKPGDEHSDGIIIDIDMEEIWSILMKELKLPRLKPKPSSVFEQTKIKYTSLSKTGPESLRHTRQTLLRALKRHACQKTLNKKIIVPGFDSPITSFSIDNSDKRYRQYKEYKIPCSNAVIFFARDCSGSMDDEKCDMVSSISWWLDSFIKHEYKNVQRVYALHDTEANEVDEETFYKYRHGGGTVCSSAFSLVSNLLENRFPHEKYNIYFFYFSDGENYGQDNEKIVSMLNTNFNQYQVNLVGITEIFPWNGSGYGSLAKHISENCSYDKYPNLKAIEISRDNHHDYGFSVGSTIAEAKNNSEHNKSVMEVLKFLLGDSPEVYRNLGESEKTAVKSS